MNRQDAKQVIFVILVIIGAVWWYEARQGSDASPLAGSPASGVQIVTQSLRSAGTGDGSLYDYITVKNTGTSFKSYVGLKGVCMNAAGTVVGDGIGNTANVGPGEETVITMIFLNVPDCDHVTIQFDALTN